MSYNVCETPFCIDMLKGGITVSIFIWLFMHIFQLQLRGEYWLIVLP